MKQEIVAIIAIIVILIVLSNFYIPTETKILINNQTTPKQLIPSEVTFVTNVSRQVATVYVPAVDNQGNGVATLLKVEAIPGEGRVLTNINQLLFWVDTQYSIQIAKNVAVDITKQDLSKVDLIYEIETNASLIEGPSAGSALAIATIAALENKPLNSSVTITGTINSDGSIGPVGGIFAKAKAAKDIGLNLFLVPKGQGTQTNYIPVERCDSIGLFTYCTIDYKQEKVNITKEAGIEVREVSNIGDALKYFLT